MRAVVHEVVRRVLTVALSFPFKLGFVLGEIQSLSSDHPQEKHTVHTCLQAGDRSMRQHKE